MERQARHAGLAGRIKIYLKAFGPGLITGAADDDPSGIGTYSQTGAQFGYAQLWTALFAFPLMTVVQEICARIAMQTGEGLAAILRKHYPKPLLYTCVMLLLLANTLNVGADLGAMAAAGALLIHIPVLLWLAVVTFGSVALQVFVPYHQYTRVLRFLVLSLFAYVLVVFIAPQDWPSALRSTLIPTLQWNSAYLLNLVAILGTTISPYLFFWQASQEVEDEIDQGKRTLAQRKGAVPADLRLMRADVTSGMLLSQVVMWFIVATTASTLFKQGITTIDSATKAAEALRPLAGDAAYVLFAVGILGTGLLAVPVLAGSAAYAVAETLKLHHGLYLRFGQARAFYAVIAVATIVGAAINLLQITPMRALYYTAVINGLAAPPLLFMVMVISNNRAIMGRRANQRLSNVVGWLTTILMTLAALALLVTSVASYVKQ